MNDQQIDDLKQFIAATVSQTEANLDGKIDSLRQEMQDGFSGVGEAIEHILTEIDEFETKTDRRSTKLVK